MSQDDIWDTIRKQAIEEMGLEGEQLENYIHGLKTKFAERISIVNGFEIQDKKINSLLNRTKKRIKDKARASGPRNRGQATHIAYIIR